ncbi:MAG: sodium/solute symporter [bacterium]|nr:sodium/solute symporter [bacterium]
MNSAIDLAIIAVYLMGTVIFGCSFFFRKKEGDGARNFMTGGGRIPTWAIALSVFATHVSSISFLALPEGAYAKNWWGWINSITVPIATLIAAIWFIPFYRKATSVSAYSFLERRFGTWARIYASACFLVMQSARSGIILLLLAILVNQLLGFSYESIIVVTGLATLVYSMMGGFSAVVWTDAVQSLILIFGTLVCVGCLLWFTPDLAANAQAAWEAGRISLGSMDLTDWGSNTFWVLFFYGICINLQNFGVDQCYTQRYIAAKDDRSAAKTIWGSACLYVPVTLLFTVIGTLLWMYNHANPGVIPEGTRAAEVFPWFIMHKLPTGVSGLLVAAIIAAAMSTVSSTLNSGSTVLLEDYWKRFCPRRATDRGNLVFLRTMTVLLALVSVGIALGVVWIWGQDNKTVLGMWYTLQGGLSGGMLGLFLIGAFSRRTKAVHALVATCCGFLALVWVTFGQQILPLPWPLHINLSIVFATLAIVVVGFALPCVFSSRENLESAS